MDIKRLMLLKYLLKQWYENENKENRNMQHSTWAEVITKLIVQQIVELEEKKTK